MGARPFFQTSVIEITMTAITTATTTITTTTPATMEGVLLEHVQVLVSGSEGKGVVVTDGIVGEHCSLREEIATEQWGSTVISIPVTMTLAPPPLTQSSIREMRESLSVSEVPSSLARYVTNDGDSSEQENDCVSMMSLQSGQ